VNVKVFTQVQIDNVIPIAIGQDRAYLELNLKTGFKPRDFHFPQQLFDDRNLMISTGEWKFP
jgi:hypothetical protein